MTVSYGIGLCRHTFGENFYLQFQGRRVCNTGGIAGAEAGCDSMSWWPLKRLAYSRSVPSFPPHPTPPPHDVSRTIITYDYSTVKFETKYFENRMANTVLFHKGPSPKVGSTRPIESP
jgi:hypothetical protein